MEMRVTGAKRVTRHHNTDAQARVQRWSLSLARARARACAVFLGAQPDTNTPVVQASFLLPLAQE